MPHDLLERLRATQSELQTSLTALQASLAETADGLRAAQGEAEVTISLATDGLPQSAQISRSWEQRIPAEELAGALTAGAQLAMLTRSLEQAGTAAPPADRAAPTQSLADTLEQTLSAARAELDGASTSAPADAATGTDRSGRVRVHSTGTEVWFTVSPAPRGATAAQLMSQVSEALHDLRVVLAARQAPAAAPAPVRTLDQLTRELVGHLQSRAATQGAF